MRLSQLFYYLRNPAAVRRGIVRRVRERISRHRRDKVLRTASGVIHVGANTGQERDMYARYNLHVVWVEPIPAAFEELQRNLVHLPRQRGLNALLTDQDGQELTFHIANNGGASSSILDLAEHRSVWPDVVYVDQIRLTSQTLPSLLRKEGIPIEQFDVLTLDTQGSELLILKGAAPLLRVFRYIKTEVADFEAYAGCAKRGELSAFLASHGFREWSVEPFAQLQTGRGGHYFDITYRRAV